ncbi:MAG: GxxExxY protein [Saprospiraceae bacterium]
MEAPENEISKAILNACIKVHRTLGPGLFESVYEGCLAYELEELGYEVRKQVVIPIQYGDLKFEGGFKLDLLVNELVIIELKSVSEIQPIHRTQLVTYLKLAEKRLGILVNFNRIKLVNGFHRIANGMPL